MSNAAKQLLETLCRHGYNYYTGVPCSLLKGIFTILERQAEQPARLTYIPAVCEDSAIGVAAGLHLGGKKPVVLMQNSGLGYSLNVLTSYNLIYDIPILLIVSWRGAFGNDAVEHDVIGKKLIALLNAVDIPHHIFDEHRIEALVQECITQMDSLKKPVALIIRDGI